MHEREIDQRLRDVELAEVPEVLRVASELYAKDRAEMERAARHEELLRAAAEAGLPAEYLERAAATIQARKAARLRRQQHWRMGAAVALFLIFRMGFVSMHAEAPSYPGPVPMAPLLPQPPPVPPSPAVLPIGHFELVDLSGRMTHSTDEPMLNTAGNDLSGLGSGIQTLGGVEFRVGDVVLVGPGHTQSDQTGGPVEVPPRVMGITIGRKARRLYFLQGTHLSAPPGTRIGSYVVYYRDGSTEAIPIRFGEDVLDWWDQTGEETEEALSHIVWRGSNEAASRHGVGIRLFMKRWENPHPELPIETLDMVTGDQPAGERAPAPFLAGLTAQ